MNEIDRFPQGGKLIEVQLRFSDEDRLGHVNNARIITLMEEARVRWAQRQQNSELFAQGYVVASLNVDYLTPVYYGKDLEVRVGVSRIGTKSFTVRHIAYQEGSPVFDGSNVLVPLAQDRKSSHALTGMEREWLAGQLLVENTDPAALP